MYGLIVEGQRQKEVNIAVKKRYCSETCQDPSNSLNAISSALGEITNDACSRQAPTGTAIADFIGLSQSGRNHAHISTNLEPSQVGEWRRRSIFKRRLDARMHGCRLPHVILLADDTTEWSAPGNVCNPEVAIRRGYFTLMC